MRARKIIPLSALPLIVLVSVGFGMLGRPGPAPPPSSALGVGSFNEPYVLSWSGDTTWIRVHTDSTRCPGDPNWGHGGEATGGPGPLETWCFEGGPGDSCGTYPPWDTNCFTHTDVRAHPSNMGINYWHVDTYRTDQRAYCGNYALWCGSDSIWTDGYPVECGTWTPGKYPGYGNQWNCVVQLTLPDTFSVANGCTLLFDPRYDTECKYDYFYVDVWNGSIWVTLAAFNASSNNPGGECGQPTGGNPDYWANTDTGQPGSADWQERFNPDLPAFYRVTTMDTLVIDSGPRFRWRFTSDGVWSDADGRGDTDGAAFIDNVWVWGDDSRFVDDFEAGGLGPLWSLPDPDPVRDDWHIRSPDILGGYTGCLVDTSWYWTSRPPGGYSGPNRNMWYYRLMTPVIPVQNSGCVIEYDEYECFLEYTCDYPTWMVRFYNAEQAKWCPWTHTIYFWWSMCNWIFNRRDNLTTFYTDAAESVQFSWGVADVAQPDWFCYGKHSKTQLVIDNVSIGFFDGDATLFSVQSIDLLYDTFHDNLCGYNSWFDVYDPDTVDRYSGPPYDDVTLRKENQLYMNVSDRDGLSGVELYGSVSDGQGWVAAAMEMRRPFDPGHPELGGEYYGTLCPDDFGLDTWDVGTEIWYYVKARDELGNEEYFPGTADPLNPKHSGEAVDYLTFSILPVYPASYTGPRILLVDGYGRRNYDYSPCVGVLDNTKQLAKIYEETLTDAGYCYDRYDISGAGSNVKLHPIEFGEHYDAIVWFTGPYFSNYLFDKEAQDSIRAYLASGGKVVLCGDRIAYNMASWSEGGVGEDSLGGEFLDGIMGCDYLNEMEGAFDKPYLYAAGVETLQVFGSPVEVDLDTFLVYRECPYLKDMSYVVVNDSAPAGYTAQTLLRLLNPNPTYDPADVAIYVESQGVGQCVFVDFDLCASANHERGYCSGDAQAPAPGFDAGTYDGRVELMRVILEDLFGLPAIGGGGPAGVTVSEAGYRWALAQNIPNPCVGSTEIRYEIGRRGRVRLKVYNALGQVVRVLEDRTREPGAHVVHWDGRNRSGEPVGSGVYFYKIEAGEFTATKKMLVLR